MSVLTKEERALVEGIRNNTALLAGMLFTEVLRIIDRLVARVEELEGEVAHWQDEVSFLREDRSKCYHNLAALIEAVEPMKLRVFDPCVGPDDNWIMVKRDEIDNLASIVQKIKEGK